MDWVDLLTPSAAILALFAAVGLVVQSIRQGRQLRQLEERVAEGGGTATKASLDRIAQLQARASTSSGAAPPGAGTRRAAIIAAGVLVAALIAGGTWFLFFRDDGGGSPSGSPSAAAPSGASASRALKPETDAVPATPPALPAPKSSYTVAILNGSGVNGAARGHIRPLVVSAGYTAGNVDDAPTSTIRRSIVYWPPGGNPAVAYNVADDLGIKRASKNDGVPKSLYGNADAIVIVGKDIAR